MRKASPRLEGSSLRGILFLTIGLVGIGLVGWAAANIGVKPVYTAVAYPGSDPRASATLSSGPNTLGVRPHPLEPGPVSAVGSSARPPSDGDRIGTLIIPALNREILVVEGTGDGELKRGVGHFSQSVMPGADDNCVLSGHRDTVLNDLGKVKKGDRLIVKTSTDTFTYAVRRIRIVDKDDRTVIVPTTHAVLTLTTCYPFHFVGNAPDRYILVADLVAPN